MIFSHFASSFQRGARLLYGVALVASLVLGSIAAPAAQASSGVPAANLRSSSTLLVPNCPDTPEISGDGDNSPAAADLITANSAPLEHLFCSSTDEDWVKFAVSANVTYQIDTYIFSTNNDPLLDVFSDAGTTLVRTNDDGDESGYGARVTFTPAFAGTYYARVRPAPGVVGDPSVFYYLRLMSRSNLCAANEPDENVVQSAPFTLGSTMSRGLCTGADQDFVRFRVRGSGTTLRIETLNLGMGENSVHAWAQTDTILELYSLSSATPLATNDDVKNGVLRSVIEYTFSSDGIYYVKVRRFASAGGPGQTYDLRITRIDDPPQTGAANLLQEAPAKPAK